MGITIHYRGRLNDKAALPLLVDEMKDMSEAMGWPSIIFDDDWDAEPDASLSSEEKGKVEGSLGLKGIMLMPHPESEPLVLLFDRGGRLQSPMNMIRIPEGGEDPDAARIAMKSQESKLALK